MTHKIHYLLLILLFITVYFFIEQERESAANQASSKIDEPLGQIADADSKIVLTIWTPTPMLDYESRRFEEANPHVDIQIQSMENEPQIAERYIDALAAGTAPDLIVLTHRMLGSFNSIEKLADLTAEPFQLPEHYREEIGEYLWDIHQSLDGKRMIAMPYEYHPQVLYYRADLLEEAGFPTEPDELTAYLKSADNWLFMARDLRQRGISVSQWENDLIYAIDAGQFFFNRSMEYQRSTAINHAAIDVMQQSKDLSANVTIWSDNGLAMLKQSKLAMLIIPSYGEGLLAQWLPEQAGKWRVIELPLDAKSIDHGSSKSIAVTTDSKHKDVANEFLQDISQSGSTMWLKDTKPSDYLGGQNSGALYHKLVHEQPVDSIPSPLDNEAFVIWKSAMDTAMIKGTKAEDAMRIAEQQIMDVVRVPLQQLLDYELRYELRYNQ